MNRPLDYFPKKEKPTFLGQLIIKILCVALGFALARLWYWWTGDLPL